MTASRWFDRWQWTDPESRCHCGHLLQEHPADRFRSCSDCLWCDDFREPPAKPRGARMAHAPQAKSPSPSGLGL